MVNKEIFEKVFFKYHDKKYVDKEVLIACGKAWNYYVIGHTRNGDDEFRDTYCVADFWEIRTLKYMYQEMMKMFDDMICCKEEEKPKEEEEPKIDRINLELIAVIGNHEEDMIKQGYTVGHCEAGGIPILVGVKKNEEDK